MKLNFAVDVVKKCVHLLVSLLLRHPTANSKHTTHKLLLLCCKIKGIRAFGLVVE